MLFCRQLFAGVAFGMCTISNCVFADDWPQWMGPERDGVWRETDLLETFPVEGPVVRWRVPVGGGYAGPAVAAGRVYVTDKQMEEGVRNPANPFDRTATPARERVVCLNENDGSILWKHEYDCPYTVSYPAGPRTTPLVHDSIVYTLGSEGDLLALHAETGALKWSRHFKKEFGRTETAVWGYSSNLLMVDDLLIALVGGVGSTVVAFHRETGKEVWRSLDSETKHGAGYSTPLLVHVGGTRQLLVWHPQAISSIDPTTGKVFWEHSFPLSNGLSVATPRVVGDSVFLSAFYDGSMLLKLDSQTPRARIVWRRHGKNEKQTEALHCLISTPVIDGNEIYGVCSHGELRCLDLATGDRLWETFQPTSGRSARWGTAFLVKQADRYFLFSEQGDLILANLSRDGYRELSRAHLLEPTGPSQRREVVWSHPAFANKSVYARNDQEIVCVSLAKPAMGKLTSK